MALPARNLLGDETSPYLQQHKANPVHWRPWTAESLAEAKALDKPILLSVGYAACHWCHVMAHESFEDDEVADVMNRLFVNIKVDREERPDIDQIYMAALQATGEQGGWPLTMFLTPDAKPFWGGTYFPKKARFGRPGFLDVLNAIHTAWREKQAELARSAEALSAHVASRLAPATEGAAATAPLLQPLAGKIASIMDPDLGGLRGAPKFPNTPFLDVLWLDWLENRTTAHRDAVLGTLSSMLAGGIYDHVGGGLARYSTDARWLVPHFEKMLYDNAQLIRLACFAHAETGDELFRTRIEEAVGWMLREMRVEGGAFASSLDADTEGEEGKFYLWKRAEIEKILGEDAETLLGFYSLSSPEGWEGDPILHRLHHPDVQPAAEERRQRELLDRLLAARESRTRPGRDDKVLVDWNGLTIAALTVAGRQLARPDWIEAAQTAYRFVCESIQDERLPHSIRGEKRLFPALASDYAAMISAAVALHGALQEDAFVCQALRWAEMLDAWHADEAGSGYFLTASDNADVPIRIRGDVDEAVPSATAQIIVALTQLSSLSGDHALYEKAARTAEAALARAQHQAYGQAGIVYAAALAQRPMKLLINDTKRRDRFVPVANRISDPRRVDVVLKKERAPAEQTAGVVIDQATPGAWLCVGQSCLPPIHDPVILEATLRSSRKE
ncbi:thioredoxin domain-containing protein [Chelativorans salis]|uniref:Thioredoxin domain-containing protein n=1 Tax=Chelativorans salis TaxID=2978478 RepID=A0ABT2LS81_9HYPH|nr:thioredoxin domain-containing protein [Chelativorans sp. EGI FJ00035]MCT7376248.1 thioredoxin domain-containing protein [Chelativorans sp. EGI FJ00035]